MLLRCWIFRRPPGRPRHTWLRILVADLQPLNLGLNSAWKYTQDREHWKHLVETATLQLGACSWWWRWILIEFCFFVRSIFFYFWNLSDVFTPMVLIAGTENGPHIVYILKTHLFHKSFPP